MFPVRIRSTSLHTKVRREQAQDSNSKSNFGLQVSTESFWGLFLETLVECLNSTLFTTPLAHQGRPINQETQHGVHLQGRCTVPPPRCSSPGKWHVVCCGSKRTPIDSLVETWVWYKLREAIRKTVVQTLLWNFLPRWTSWTLALAPLVTRKKKQPGWDFSSINLVDEKGLSFEEDCFTISRVR